MANHGMIKVRENSYLCRYVGNKVVPAYIEIKTENHGVGGSIPPLGTILFNKLVLIVEI